ncbi:hypothetical protein ACTPOK_09955 [Streptomyces inhibens]
MPAGTTMQQFSSGEVEPRLVDQALAIAKAARRRQQVNLAMDAPDDDS